MPVAVGEMIISSTIKSAPDIYLLARTSLVQDGPRSAQVEMAFDSYQQPGSEAAIRCSGLELRGLGETKADIFNTETRDLSYEI